MNSTFPRGARCALPSRAVNLRNFALVASVSFALSCRASEPGERAASHRPSAIASPTTPSGAAIAPPSPTDSMEPSLAYIERVTGGADPNDALPMIVALHGMGDRPEGAWATMYSQLTLRARVILPRAPTPYGNGASWFTFRSGQRDDTTMAPQIARAADRIDALVMRLVGSRPTQGKALVVGFSQGGVLAYALALRHGPHYAAVIPMAGFVPPSLVSRGSCATAPQMRALHGLTDDVIPIEWERESMRALDSARCMMTLSAIPELGHTSSPTLINLLNDAVRSYVDAPRP